MNYYKITKEQANALKKITYAPGKMFDPFVNEQKDGTYLVSETMFNQLKNRVAFKAIDWTKLTKITAAQIDSKQTLIAPK